MKDFKGNELNIGDKVIYVRYTKGSSNYLAEGIIVKFSKAFGKDTAKIKTGTSNFLTGSTSQNIYKL